jgi:hypothetical protein
MSSKRSAVKPSECENVAKKPKKRKILNQGFHQRSKITVLRDGKKISMRALILALTIPFGLSREQIEVKVQNVLIFHEM